MSFMIAPHRRGFLHSLVGGSLLLPGILAELLAADATRGDPLTPPQPQSGGKARRVVFLFSPVGVSHMDTFDPTPKLFAADGKALGAGGGLSDLKKPLLRPGWAFRPGGSCGTQVSDLFPHLRQRMDDVCLVRSMK